LIETFNEAELRRFVATYYPDLAEEISARRVSRAELTTEVVDSLSRNHAVGGALFAALVEMRPRLGARIEELKRALASAEAVEAVPTVAARTESRQLDVMFVAANPVALPELQLSAEARRIEDKLRGTPGEHRIDIRYCWSAGPDSMIDMLYRGVPDVLQRWCRSSRSRSWRARLRGDHGRAGVERRGGAGVRAAGRAPLLRARG
jgi:hypothetical protein